MKHFYRIPRWTRAYSGAAILVFMVMANAAWSQPASTATDNLYYTHSAKAGDTLIHLAKRYLIKPQNWQSLQKLNKIADPHRIRPGTAIRIPLVDMKTTPAIASVVSLEGPVESTAGTLKVGSAISEGQSIKTGENGFVTLKLADGSTLVCSRNRKCDLISRAPLPTPAACRSRARRLNRDGLRLKCKSAAMRQDDSRSSRRPQPWACAAPTFASPATLTVKPRAAKSSKAL